MIKVGIIGCGAITQLRHAPEYSSNANCKIVGFYDINRKRAEETASRFGGRVYESYKDLLLDKDIDAVSVCTSNTYHAAITIEALQSGKHVLCEKPMAVSIEEASNMINAAKEADKCLMIGHNQRFAAAHLKAKEILNRGELGKILTFRTTFGHRGPEYWSADKNKSTWFFNKDSAFMGAIGDLGIHKIELIRWLVEDEIDEVSAFMATLDKTDNDGNFIGVDDNTLCILKTKSGVMGTMAVSWTYYGDEENCTSIYCTNGIIKIYDNPEYEISISKNNGEKSFYKLGKIQTNESQTNSGVIDEFIDSIIDNRKPQVSGEDGLATLKVVLACIESAKEGRVIKVN